MRIEVKKTQSFKYEILDALRDEPDVKNKVVEAIKRRAVKAFEESLSEVLRLREYLDEDEIEISVGVGIGNPDEEDDEVELDTDEE